MEEPVIEEKPQAPKNWLTNYALMWIGQILSLLGSSVVQFALVWYLTEKTGSAVVLTTTMLVGMVPEVFLGPFSGAIVDRLNRKMIMIVSDALVALATLALVFLFAAGWVQLWHIYVIIFIRSLVGTFQYPAGAASISLMVPKEHLTRLAGINQAARGFLQIAAPPLGALLIKFWPVQNVLAVDLVTAALAVFLLVLFVKVPQPKQTKAPEPISASALLKDVGEGFRYIYAWKGLLWLMIGALLINMIATPAFSLLPLYVTQYYGKGATELAWLESALGIGMIAGGLLLGVWGGFKRKIYTVICGNAGMGIGIILLGLLSKTMYQLAIPVMGLIGLTNGLTNGPFLAIFQTKIRPDMQGRILTAVNSLAVGATPLGLLLAGPLADTLGIKVFYLAAGVMCLLIAAGWLKTRQVYTLEDQEEGGRLAVEPAASAEE
ncbi:MAG: MFS transporter [Chloroflexi bacterium]|nr:MFS transporter [Chloroflexota bacterium]